MSQDRKKVAIFNKETVSSFYPGIRVVLYEPDDFELEATLESEEIEGGTTVWYGVIDWDTYQDISDSGSDG